MKEKHGKKDLLLIGALLLVALVLLGVSRLMPKADIADRVADTTMAPDAVAYLDATPAPTDEPKAAATEIKDAQSGAEAAAFGPMPAPQTQAVKGHVVITVNGRQYGDPIAMDRDKVVTVRQEDGKINKVHITPERVYMESSTCENQDCVGEGEITLDNYKTRILSTYIICLPNTVSIEMIPVE